VYLEHGQAVIVFKNKNEKNHTTSKSSMNSLTSSNISLGMVLT